jgi:hypothetical protein
MFTLRGTSRSLAGLGVLLLLVDIVLRVGSTLSLEMILAEGQPFDKRPEQSIESPNEKTSDDPLLPHIAFAPLKIVPDYGPTGERVATAVHLRILGENPTDLKLTDQNDVVVDRVRIRLQEVGLAPMFAIRRAPDSEPFTMVASLNVWGPGALEDSFRIEQPPATAWVRFYPDFQEGPEGPSSRSMAPRNPVLHVRVVPDDPAEESGEAFLPLDNVVKFGNYELKVVELRHWGLFHVSETRGVLLLSVSLLAIALGWGGGLAANRRVRTQLQRTEAVVS